MAKFYSLHPQNPQQRDLEAIAKQLRSGAVMLYPTDTVYAIGCDLTAKNAVQKVRQLKRLANDKPLTFLCSSLSNISEYAMVSDDAYRIMKRVIPGPYTFLLPATKQVPKLVMSPKRRSTGIRVPDNAICQGLLQALGNPIISTSAHLPDEDGEPFTLDLEKALLFDALEPLVDIIIDSDAEPGNKTSTILDFCDRQPALIRKGLGWDALASWIDLVDLSEAAPD
ncbi:Sua5/YciO/YrdC/YwlC family protein [[Synechococcus] sp. NIES-970]|uniref:L-threonylcarbamoyladenylate synthase n=1 Tax=Picosynechococcus sp. NKBG15041c TaxID=1407650 RepID=UPI0004041A53|nr:L-threonylcarbamoyladenylate synthase [Picosynechococcus sp. NKBG15041c]BAW97082.1 Sua5/YciO/YrdC/YwlC family protein [[Synechococcus] sp. NIES-970]